MILGDSGIGRGWSCPGRGPSRRLSYHDRNGKRNHGLVGAEVLSKAYR